MFSLHFILELEVLRADRTEECLESVIEQNQTETFKKNVESAETLTNGWLHSHCRWVPKLNTSSENSCRLILFRFVEK